MFCRLIWFGLSFGAHNDDNTHRPHCRQHTEVMSCKQCLKQNKFGAGSENNNNKNNIYFLNALFLFIKKKKGVGPRKISIDFALHILK